MTRTALWSQVLHGQQIEVDLLGIRLILPHAIQEPNAFYDPNMRAVVFGYFTVSDKDPGRNLPGTFTDPSLPEGYAPFGIAPINGKLYVTYAKQDDNAEDDVHGPGNGFIDVFETNGTLNRRFASQGVLNSPWGVVLAPAGFGSLGGALLVNAAQSSHSNTGLPPADSTATRRP